MFKAKEGFKQWVFKVLVLVRDSDLSKRNSGDDSCSVMETSLECRGRVCLVKVRFSLRETIEETHRCKEKRPGKGTQWRQKRGIRIRVSNQPTKGLHR